MASGVTRPRGCRLKREEFSLSFSRYTDFEEVLRRREKIKKQIRRMTDVFWKQEGVEVEACGVCTPEKNDE